MKKTEVMEYKIGDSVEFFRTGRTGAECEWLKGTVYLVGEKPDGFGEYEVLVESDLKIHDMMTLGGHGWYERRSKNIRKTTDGK